MIQERRFRIVHIVTTLKTGGLEMFLLRMARHHDQKRFDLHVLSLGEIDELGPRFAALGVPAESLDCDGRSKGTTLWRLAGRLLQLRPDLVHTHNAGPHLYGTLVARLAGLPVIHTKHGRNRPYYRPAVLVNRAASALSRCIVAVSHDAARVARDIERVPVRKLRVIHNGVDLDEFRRSPECEREEESPAAIRNPQSSSCYRAINVARLSEIKDQRTLLHAVRRVVDAEPAFHLDVVGDGPLREELVALRDRLGLHDSVRFVGQRSDVADHLARADFFVLSSVSEGVSLTLLEAMAMGLPVVATAVGGNPEVVAQGETGLLVPPGSPDELAAAMLALARDPATVWRMGQAGRRRAVEHFDLRRAVTAYEQLYLSLLKQEKQRNAS